MLGPRSYTAEDVVEIHTHGGGVSAQRVLQSCLGAGARLARPGEFTLRAFLNGRMTLSEVGRPVPLQGLQPEVNLARCPLLGPQRPDKCAISSHHTGYMPSVVIGF
jgi:hypothetical protein